MYNFIRYHNIHECIFFKGGFFRFDIKTLNVYTAIKSYHSLKKTVINKDINITLVFEILEIQILNINR